MSALSRAATAVPAERFAAAFAALLLRRAPAAVSAVEWQCGRGDRRTEKGKRKAHSNGAPPPRVTASQHLTPRREVPAEERLRSAEAAYAAAARAAACAAAVRAAEEERLQRR